jgi:hypothetical protein
MIGTALEILMATALLVFVADAVGVVGSTADALHNGIDNFFSNIRARLGI